MWREQCWHRAKARADKTGYKNIYIFSSSVGSPMESWTNPTLLEFIYSKKETLRATESTESKQKAAGGLLLYLSISPFTLYKILFKQR